MEKKKDHTIIVLYCRQDKQELAKKLIHIIKNPFDVTFWQQVDRLTSQWERLFIDQEIHWPLKNSHSQKAEKHHLDN